MKGKRRQRLLAFVLAMMMTFSMVSNPGIVSHAEEMDENAAPISSALQK